jgi:tetratricopeptide (TPR) repeat protein
MSIRETMSPRSFRSCLRPILGASLRRRCKTDRIRRSSAKATGQEQVHGRTNLARGLCLRKDGFYATGKKHRCCDSRGHGLAYNGSAAGSRPARDDRQSHRLLPAAVATQSAEFARVLWIGRRADPKARETGDPSYFGRAEEALKKSREINPNNAGAMRHLGYVFYSRHEFESAAVHARKAIDMDATDGDSYGIWVMR